MAAELLALSGNTQISSHDTGHEIVAEALTFCSLLLSAPPIRPAMSPDRTMHT
jgi:hypothetical protein